MLRKNSVSDNISLYGGRIICDNEKKDTTHFWDMTEEFKQDIRTMWGICRNDCGAWNWQMDVLSAVELYREPNGSPMETIAPRAVVSAHMENNGRNGFLFRYDLINELIAEGLILSFEFNRNNPIHIEYKNEQIKRCLTKSGQVLELIVYLLACEAREKNGNPTYNDVMTGVFIDWDGEVHDGNEKHEAENEVDVIMMRGMVPIFVSCKNGNVNVDELYKLYSVAYKFGGKYAKKVLIAPCIEGNANVDALRERCSDMQIRIIDNIEDMDEDKLLKTIKGLWSQN